ncbi:hypothetical protein FMEXI_2369 [Fusarium mexicanum]|uniref:Uncharacterized protein n=1 Tax=Fusarium mexicanum TaxID=751941 RepID=A0A8H5JDT6_9HYPO|nr:hypothetical protein FMEXI_2369 [Fusarium mexicanum]
MRLEQLLTRNQGQDSEPASPGQTVEARIETAEKEIKAVKRRIRTAGREIEALQKRTDEIDPEGYDAKLLEVQQELNEVEDKCSGIENTMVTRENLEDFGEDIRQTIGKRIMGHDH